MSESSRTLWLSDILHWYFIKSPHKFALPKCMDSEHTQKRKLRPRIQAAVFPNYMSCAVHPTLTSCSVYWKNWNRIIFCPCSWFRHPNRSIVYFHCKGWSGTRLKRQQKLSDTHSTKLENTEKKQVKIHCYIWKYSKNCLVAAHKY
jgi:hypothetical protein